MVKKCSEERNLSIFFSVNVYRVLFCLEICFSIFRHRDDYAGKDFGTQLCRLEKRARTDTKDQIPGSVSQRMGSGIARSSTGSTFHQKRSEVLRFFSN